MSSHEEDNEKDDSQGESSYFGAAVAGAIGIFLGAGITYFASRNTATENPQCNTSSRNLRPSNSHSSSNSNYRNRDKICETCTICLDNTNVVTLPCTHLFHYTCIKPWFMINQICPTCRAPVDPAFIRKNF
ncbi:unnamed protein product [Parnassius apollo]|uniref:RING-type E3 ubiquitin transferase n=1 Tax=Parnassius apollo TaxID=110799 RepID=A0A8S3XQP3_PARAO|nr:unnamed protein product [Parnassius apollo]